MDTWGPPEELQPVVVTEVSQEQCQVREGRHACGALGAEVEHAGDRKLPEQLPNVSAQPLQERAR